MLYLFWYNAFIVLCINALYNYLRQGAVIASGSVFRVSVHRAFRRFYSLLNCPENRFLFVSNERS